MPSGAAWDAIVDRSRAWEAAARKVRALRVTAALSLATGVIIYILTR